MSASTGTDLPPLEAGPGLGEPTRRGIFLGIEEAEDEEESEKTPASAEETPDFGPTGVPPAASNVTSSDGSFELDGVPRSSSPLSSAESSSLSAELARERLSTRGNGKQASTRLDPNERKHARERGETVRLRGNRQAAVTRAQKKRRHHTTRKGRDTYAKPGKRNPRASSATRQGPERS